MACRCIILILSYTSLCCPAFSAMLCSCVVRLWYFLVWLTIVGYVTVARRMRMRIHRYKCCNGFGLTGRASLDAGIDHGLRLIRCTRESIKEAALLLDVILGQAWAEKPRHSIAHPPWLCFRRFRVLFCICLKASFPLRLFNVNFLAMVRDFHSRNSLLLGKIRVIFLLK